MSYVVIYCIQSLAAIDLCLNAQCLVPFLDVSRLALWGLYLCMVFFNMFGSHHVQGDASSQPDDLQEGAKEDRGERQGGQGEGEGESPLGEVD